MSRLRRSAEGCHAIPTLMGRDVFVGEFCAHAGMVSRITAIMAAEVRVNERYTNDSRIKNRFM